MFPRNALRFCFWQNEMKAKGQCLSHFSKGPLTASFSVSSCDTQTQSIILSVSHNYSRATRQSHPRCARLPGAARTHVRAFCIRRSGAARNRGRLSPRGTQSCTDWIFFFFFTAGKGQKKGEGGLGLWLWHNKCCGRGPGRIGWCVDGGFLDEVRVDSSW